MRFPGRGPSFIQPVQSPISASEMLVNNRTSGLSFRLLLGRSEGFLVLTQDAPDATQGCSAASGRVGTVCANNSSSLRSASRLPVTSIW